MAKRRRSGGSLPSSGPAGTIFSGVRPERHQDVAMFGLLFFAALLAHWPALGGNFLWDDSGHVTKMGLRSLHGLWRIWFDLGATQQYYPLLHSAFWLEYHVWGDSVVGYHLVNLVLNAVSGILVVLVVRRLQIPGAWLAGFIFVLHPVGVESVAWISEQKTMLSTFFYLASGLMYLHFDHSRRRVTYFLAFGLFALALGSKSVTATLPAALLVIFWWQRGRLEWRRDILPLVPWLILGTASGLFTAWVENTYIGAHGTAFTASPLQRLLLAGRVIWFYLGKLIWPSNLAFFYPHWTIDPGQWPQYVFIAGVVILSVVLSLIARRNRGPLAGFLFFIGTLFPVLGFFNVFPFRYSYVADHFQYLAMLGIIVPTAAVLSKAATRLTTSELMRVFGFVLLPVTLGGLTWNQSRMYANNETLFRETLVRNPDSSIAHNNLGVELAKEPRRLPDAIAQFEAALAIDPNSAEAHENLGVALSKSRGRLPEAVEHLEAALKLQPDYPESHLNLGSALSEVPGRLPDAITQYKAALQIKPDYEEAHLDLGTAFSAMPGRQADAIGQYETVLQINPNSAKAHYSLANVLAGIPGRGFQAISEYEVALRINPEYVEARTNLATLLSSIPGRLQDAIAEYQTVLRLNPESAEAHFDLGLAYSRMPDHSAEATSEFKEALRLRPDLQQARLLIERLQAAPIRATQSPQWRE